MPSQTPAAASAVTSAAPPRARARYPGETLVALRRDALGFFTRLAREHGDVVRFSLGGERAYLVSDPELVREVLVTRNRSFVKGRALDRARFVLGEGLLTSNGDFHLRQRRLAQPAFHRERIAGYAATMTAFTERHQARWRDGETLEVAEAMARLTLAIAGKTLFDADVEDEAGDIGAALAATMRMFELVSVPFAELLLLLPLPGVVRLRRARSRLDATIYRIIAERRAVGRDRGDLLSMLMLARDEEGDGGAMSDRQLRDEALTLFLAGHETTANALTWAWSVLAEHPAVEQTLHAEVDSVLGGRAPGWDDLPRLPFTRAVLAESMRLRPPVWIIGRRATEDVPLGRWTIPRRSLVVMSQWVVHRDPRWWPEPERFDPTRWLAERGRAQPKLAYFPFSAGTRVCIGEQFAWTEGVLVLATIARRWRLRRDPGVAPARPRPVLTLRTDGPVPLRLERRA
ncbi:MAG TPA: cytochrome P450 [Gemmatimonadaceae bacterium]|nr:cytochrome P450 [Gemmatimonadaceae bacterium]